MDLGAVRTALGQLYAAVAAPAEQGGAGSLGLDALLEAVQVSQEVANIAAGIQTRAIAHVAAHEEVVDDEAPQGWSWRRHGLGWVAEDAPALVATRLGVSAPVAQRRVEAAVHQVCVTPQLVDAMGAGELDLWRATVLTRELTPCPDEVAHEIADRLAHRADQRGGWDESAGPLAGRARRLIARLAPEVADHDAKQARADRSLVRRAVSAAADQWDALVPAEQSLVMWQAVDALARQLRRHDPELTLAQARLDAMAQLILQQVEVTLHLHATTPATPDADTASDTDAEGDADADAERAADTERDADADDDAGPDNEDELHAERDADADNDAGADGEDKTHAEGDADTESVTDAGADTEARAGGEGGAGADVTGSDAHSCAPVVRRGVFELGGLGRPGTTRVDLDALPPGTRILDSTPLTCDPDTGALLSGIVPKSLAPRNVRAPDPDTIEEGYRPSPALQRLIRLRDGHCRFPGCPINARFCDLDHVTPWPEGPTTATNLICLCRRHHRIKQRPGWSARLDPDGVVHWRDPGGRTTDTLPVDHLDRHHQPPPPTPPGPSAPARPDARAEARPDNFHDPEPGSRPDDPALIPTLLELSLTRLLDLAHAHTSTRPMIRVDWSTDTTQARPVLVDVDVTGTPAPDTDDPPF